MKTLAAVGIVSLFASMAPSTVQEAAPPDGTQRAVLITGASSGIGRRTAEVLAENGFYVYAGARKAADIEALSAIPNVEGLRLDVTVQAEIDAAVETVTSGGRGLHGLINNAGVAVLAPLIEAGEEDLTFQWDVNVMGPYRVTKAFAPLLIEAEGRVSTTGSISGTVTWPLGGPYTMSKFAVEAYTDSLAAELAPFGVEVSVVQPGNYKSRIFENMSARMKERGFETDGSLYQEQLDRMLGGPLDREQYKEPDEVAAAFLHAMTSDAPKRRYLVVPNQREAEFTIRAAITRLVQQNQAQAYTYSRDELVEMLDAALAAAGEPATARDR